MMPTASIAGSSALCYDEFGKPGFLEIVFQENIEKIVRLWG